MEPGHLPLQPADGLGPEALSAALFEGTCVVFGKLREVPALQAAVIAHVEGAFGPDPETAEAHLDADAFRTAATRARRAVLDDAEIDRIWAAILQSVGYADEDIHRDRLRLRVVPSAKATTSRFIRPLPPHRDSWGSGVQTQINWWMPLYPLVPTRTIVLWPELFDVPVANTAKSWDYDRLMSGTDKTYPLLPEATESPEQQAVPLVIEPGEIAAFSAAHLHRSANDSSGRTRFSLDTRTVWADDVTAGRGAPDVDGHGRLPRYDMFERQGAAAAR